LSAIKVFALTEPAIALTFLKRAAAAGHKLPNDDRAPKLAVVIENTNIRIERS
jgi:hypothetical protein